MKEHSMTPDDLRALAEALAEYAESPDRVSYQAEPILRSADYLRAQADALPVGVYEHRSAEMRYGVRWLVDELPDGTPLYAYPVPVAAQAEPKHGRIEVNVEPDTFSNWCRVTLTVGWHTFFMECCTEHPAEAVKYAAELRTALGIGDSDD